VTQTLEQLVVELRADVGSLRSQLRVAEGTVASSSRRMERDLGGLSRGFSRIGSSVKALGVGLAGYFGAAGVGSIVSTLANATRGAIENAAALQDLSARAGISAEKYQELRFAISQAGGDVGGLDNAVLAFSRNLSNLERGTGSLSKFLKDADPEFAAVLRGATDTGEAFDLLADRVASLSSEQDRLALIQAATGKTGRELVLAFAEGSAGLEEYARQAREAGAVVSNEAVKSADDLADAVGRVADVVRAQFTSSVLDAKGPTGELLGTLSDPDTVEQIGELAADVGALARVFLELAASAGSAIREIRNLSAFGDDAQLRALADAVATMRAGGAPEGDIAPLEAKLRERMNERSSRLEADDVRAQRAELAASLGFDEFGNPVAGPASSRRFAPGLSTPAPKAPKGSKGPRDAAGRDPLAAAVGTIREEMAAVEKLADERARFEESVTRDLERATLTRTELIQLETTRRIEEIDRLGFAEEKAAELRTDIEAEGAAKRREIESETLDGLVRMAEVGVETVGDLLASKLVGDAEISFAELAKSFAKTLIRMEITAAATSIGEILRTKIEKASADTNTNTGSADDSTTDAPAGNAGHETASKMGNVGGSLILALLGSVFKFAEGGLVTGPMLGMIGEDPATRPELVIPLSKFEKLRGDGGGGRLEVVNAVPGVVASARKVRRNGREQTVVQLEAAFGSLLARGAFRDQLGGRHAPGMR
jgi:hypothetical protein